MAKKKAPKSVETITHGEASRKNIPTAEYQSIMTDTDKAPVRVEYERRNRDLDPQLVWRGKDEQDWSDLVVNAPPLYIQEKVHPKVLIDDLRRQSEESTTDQYENSMFEFLERFNGLPSEEAKTEFYQHDANWSNRMILGDSLQVMASLAEREGLRGKVQCIYFDPPYGIKFNSNFQWSTTSRDVKDGKFDHITREPEQVKAFRDTWRDGIHSYLTYLRDRLTVARELLSVSGSVFIQIGDENVHRVRALAEEVFGDDNFVSQINVVKTSGLSAADRMNSSVDYILWFAKDKSRIKYRQLLIEKDISSKSGAMYRYIRDEFGMPKRISGSEQPDPQLAYRLDNITKPGPGSKYTILFQGNKYTPGARWWGTTELGMSRVIKANRLASSGKTVSFFRSWQDYVVQPLNNLWADTATGGFLEQKIYVVQTTEKIVQRCILSASDPGDLVLDPTCGSGTSAYVAEQWGRRWITIDTSRVALALARSRIMGARYPYYLLSDSKEGQIKESELSRTPPSSTPTYEDIRHGFVYERVPHITLKAIANNVEIDVIWDEFQKRLEPLREELNKALGESWEEWEIPREPDDSWSQYSKETHRKWWGLRIARQKEIDASIAAKADFEYLYDKPYEDNKKVRVAGPFTVESLSPHRVLGVDENDELIKPKINPVVDGLGEQDFNQMILETLKTSGVQQAHKEDKINFTSLVPWPGALVSAEGKFFEGGDDKGTERRAAIFIGPEFGTVSRPDLVEAAREAADAGFDVLIACAFNFDAHSTEFNKLGRIPVLKARMNADLHMADDLKNTGKGNLFVIFGEPDIDILDADDDQIMVKVKGVDVFHPNTGEVRSDGPDGIACWFIDTDYNEESFFVRHAYFLGANDPYKALKTTLKAEIDEEAWETLNSDTSRPFDKPQNGRIAVKVINHLGDEVMKVFRV
ncbi:adenine-specific DNA-methyltransferase [Paucidesulfovibrio gracilis DSM 16080]|uniref:Adenine-specific DNA-methyltransferase n=1 Tax=Paucidesulfovibrio gracilis DSM 16080 TaxID=1121449 RepID=A0A1T4WLM6_9BACT|nr:site-specific DNA-methyltransferase [Paucidesulfovibrio gracilis]SKA78260.1 adenine-specific DNA-methyltransferase [Paucidesulfovibrio gracilis DSM 16080]